MKAFSRLFAAASRLPRGATLRQLLNRPQERLIDYLRRAALAVTASEVTLGGQIQLRRAYLDLIRGKPRFHASLSPDVRRGEPRSQPRACGGERACSTGPCQGPGGGLLAEPAREESPSSRSMRRCVAIASRSACSLVRCGATVRRRVSPVAGALVVFAAPPSTDSVVRVALDACVAAPSRVWTVAGGDVSALDDVDSTVVGGDADDSEDTPRGAASGTCCVPPGFVVGCGFAGALDARWGAVVEPPRDAVSAAGGPLAPSVTQ